MVTLDLGTRCVKNVSVVSLVKRQLDNTFTSMWSNWSIFVKLFCYEIFEGISIAYAMLKSNNC